MPVQNKSHVPIGTVLEGKFRVTREIGRGGMAAVYEAENIDIGKRVAVKILAAELITSRVVRERFIREARAASAVRSPHICDVYDSGMYEERPFLVMELLEGESLYDMLTRLRRLDIETTVTVITQTARGLAKAHEANIVHRDLKPENIFVTRTEEQGMCAKLLDFGLAKFYEPTNDGDPKTVRLTREGALFGTPAYMSPEQAKGQGGEVDHRSDLWALGCIAYECLTGQTVWSVDQGVAMILAQVAGAPLPRPSRLRPDLPTEFESWFMKALERDQTKRYQNARDLADGLEAAFGIGIDQEVSQRWRRKEPSLHTDLEATSLDELLASAPEASPEIVNGDAEPGGEVMTPEPAAQRPASNGLGALAAVSVVALASYGAWFYWLHPPGEIAVGVSSTKGTKPVSSAPAKSKFKPSVDPETEPYAIVLGEAQTLFGKDPKKALEKFKQAYAMGSAAPARSLMSHATVAVEEATPKGCKVTAISRPRPYSIEAAASPPGLVHTPEGALLTWTDTSADPRRRQGYSVLLDDALRRRGPPLAVTPEATNVDDFATHAVGQRVAFVYTDAAGKESGVYSRQLEPDGRIGSSAKRLSSAKPAEFEVSLAAAGDGGYYVVWTEQLEFGSTDLVVRRLSAALEPTSEPSRLSAFTLVKGLTKRAAMPEAVVAHGELEIAFSLLLPGQRQQVMLLSIPLAQLAKGLPMPKPGKRQPPPKNDTTLGTLRSVAPVVGRSPEPGIACTQEGCLVAWDEERRGAAVAFLEHGQAKPLWHREFAKKGSRPALFGDETGGAIAWFEESRLRFASIGRDGLGTPSVLNRVNGFQPHPAIARGAKPGEWLVAWRDYEAGHLELFALRAECPP
jgi:serine/threonine-protein kinase